MFIIFVKEWNEMMDHHSPIPVPEGSCGFLDDGSWFKAQPPRLIAYGELAFFSRLVWFIVPIKASTSAHAGAACEPRGRALPDRLTSLLVTCPSQGMQPVYPWHEQLCWDHPHARRQWVCRSEHWAGESQPWVWSELFTCSSLSQ